jgi:hypothetical protein
LLVVTLKVAQKCLNKCAKAAADNTAGKCTYWSVGSSQKIGSLPDETDRISFLDISFTGCSIQEGVLAEQAENVRQYSSHDNC